MVAAGLGTFGLFATVPTLIGAAGAIGVATAMNRYPEMVKNSRMRKLKKLAESVGCKLGYDIDDTHYGLFFIDENGNILNNEQVIALGQENGIDVQAELDKIAGNDTRGVDFKQQYIDEKSKTLLDNCDEVLRESGLKVDRYYYKKTGQIYWIDQKEEILSDDVEFTEEVAAQLQEKHAAVTDRELVSVPENYASDIQEQLKAIKEEDYNLKLLFNKKNTELLKRERLNQVNFDNLIDFD